MTLVAALAIADHPFLIGDILISSPRKEANYPAFNAPTRSNINAGLPSTSSHIVSALSRKLAILEGRLAIGWSGHEIAAKAAINDITRAVKHNNFRYDDLMRLLDSIFCLQYLGQMELSICGMMIEGADLKMFSRGDATHFHSDAVGDILSAGSGTGHFFEIISSTGINSDLVPNSASATCAVASWVGTALGEQMSIEGA